MANEIRYEVMGNYDDHHIKVKYSMGEHSVEVALPWHGEGDLDEFIKSYVPRQQLKAMAAPSHDFAALTGKTGTADLELPPPPAPPEVEPPATSG
jgi:hypothetical protein